MSTTSAPPAAPSAPAGADGADVTDLQGPVDPTAVRPMPTRVTAAELREWLTRPDRPRLVDVRSAAEFRAAHIPGAYNVPLPLLKEHRDEFAEPLDEQVVLICRTDNRASQAEQVLAAAGLGRLHVLTGGMTAWQQDNGPVRETGGAWDLERQVRLVAGGLVASGVLASTVAPRAKWFAGAIGAGLVTAALTDSCLMGALLAKMPHNRSQEPDAADVLASLAR